MFVCLLFQNRLQSTDDEFLMRYTFKCQNFRQCMQIAQFGLFFLIVNVKRESNKTIVTAWVQCVGRRNECKLFTFNLQMRIGNSIAHFTDYVSISLYGLVHVCSRLKRMFGLNIKIKFYAHHCIRTIIWTNNELNLRRISRWTIFYLILWKWYPTLCYLFVCLFVYWLFVVSDLRRLVGCSVHWTEKAMPVLRDKYVSEAYQGNGSRCQNLQINGRTFWPSSHQYQRRGKFHALLRIFLGEIPLFLNILMDLRDFPLCKSVIWFLCIFMNGNFLGISRLWIIIFLEFFSFNSEV